MRRTSAVHVVLACTALAAVGLFDGGLGVAWPSMRDTFDQPLAALGVVLLAYTGGYFATSAAGGYILERTGTGNALLGVAASAIAGAALFAASPTWPVVLAGALLLGASGGAADLTLNHEFAQNHGVRALGFLHAAWGLGSAAAPLIVTGFVTSGRTWRYAFVPAIAVQAALLVAYVVIKKTWAPVPSRHDGPDDAEPLDRLALFIGIASFLVYVGVESGVGAWGFTLLTDDRGMRTGAAGAWMAAFWFALTAGRVLLGLAGHIRGPDLILTGSVAVAVAATAVLWLDPAGIGELALVPLGLALAPIFPVLVAVTPERLGVHRAARAIGAQIAASAVGGVVLTSGFGIFAQEWGTDALGPSFTLAAVLLAALHGAALLRRRPMRP